jgi:hypothetical protein
VSRTVQESNVFIRLGIVLSEKQIPRFIGNVSSYELRIELLELTPVLCKQGVAGSIPVTSTNFISALSIIYTAIPAALLWCNFGTIGTTATFVGSDFRRPDLSSPTRNDTTIRGGSASFSVSRIGNHHYLQHYSAQRRSQKVMRQRHLCQNEGPSFPRMLGVTWDCSEAEDQNSGQDLDRRRIRN